MAREVRQASSPETIRQIVVSSSKDASEKEAADELERARQRAAALKSLILKTANEVYHYVDRIVTQLDEVYVAKSVFGEFTETIQRTIEDTARGTVESYGYTSLIQGLSDDVEVLNEYATEINGQIRRGIVVDPSTQEETLGITISESLVFTGAEHHENGLTYYYLAPGQTFGMYTSKGWQFWINGRKTGWFDSNDGKLHVANIIAESSMQIGSDWIMTATGGFGIRYIGGTS